MNKEFYQGNREKLYAQMKENALLVLFSGTEVRKTNDEFYPFYTNRNFLYLTGLDQKELALIARKDGAGRVTEKVYILPPDWLVERWSGERIKAAEAAERSGIADVGYTDSFEAELHRLATSGNYRYLYLDLFRVSPTDRDEPAHRLLKRVASDYPYLQIENANALIRRMRTIKQPCELEAMRKAEEITCAGITAMMSFDPDENDPQTIAQAMVAAAQTVSTAQITYAARNSDFDGFAINEGDYLALLDGKLFGTSRSMDELLDKLSQHAAQAGAEYINIYTGEGVSEAEGAKTEALFAQCCPDAEVAAIPGGQSVYFYIISIE